jgi:glycosyltransferase involved in cell wall biosynthesis
MARVPTIVSVDATPLQYDELGAHYDHRAGNRHVERLKWRANRACFQRATHIVSWSSWAKHGLVDGYGVDADKITVIPPGVAPSAWAPQTRRSGAADPVRILFVGADLERKGGDLLVRAVQELRGDGTTGTSVELDLVTRSAVPAQAGVTVHKALEPGSPELVELYRRADIFCLPTRADCLPMVLSEAGAAGLPVVSTAVAGIPEIVRDGTTGLLVPADDPGALVRALRALVDDPALRSRLGDAARSLVEREFNAETNAHRLVDLLAGAASGRPEQHP